MFVFFNNTPMPASNNLWTKVQLNTKSNAFLWTNSLLSLISFFQPTVQYFSNCVTALLAYEFFGMFASTRTPNVLLGGR